MKRVHVLPVNDLIEHELTDDCICGPDCEYVPGGVLISHNSLDGRELIEYQMEAEAE